MVIGFHFIFSAYGFWLPNDPRGSWSQTIRQYELLAFGPPTKVNTSDSQAAKPHDSRQRLAAKRALRYPPVQFTGEQARLIAHGFKTACNEKAYAPHALAILRDHAHLVLAWHPRPIDRIAAHLKAKATGALSTAGDHPLAPYASPDGRKPSPWARNHWCPFIRAEAHMRTAIAYVENNPVKAGLPRQRWSLVGAWSGAAR